MVADLLSDRELEHLRRIRFCQGSRHSLSLADEGSVGYTAMLRRAGRRQHGRRLTLSCLRDLADPGSLAV